MSLPKVGLIAVSVAALVGLAACGGDDSKSAETSGKTTTTSTPKASGSADASGAAKPSGASTSAAAKAPAESTASGSAGAKKPTASGTASDPAGKKPAAGKAGTYVDYATYKKSGAAKDAKTVLFFHAKWCPSCKSLDANLTKSVPAGLNVVKVDFDEAKDLKKKYSVTQQHTFVQVDGEGKQLHKWSGAKDGAAIAAKLK